MGGLLYTYGVTSIKAAKRNAKLHAEADGGQIDMRRESMRRHGVLEKVPGTSGVELFRNVGWGLKGEEKKKPTVRGKTVDKRPPRTEVESKLEEYKGPGKAEAKFKTDPPVRPED